MMESGNCKECGASLNNAEGEYCPKCLAGLYEPRDDIDDYKAARELSVDGVHGY